MFYCACANYDAMRHAQRMAQLHHALCTCNNISGLENGQLFEKKVHGKNCFERSKPLYIFNIFIPAAGCRSPSYLSACQTKWQPLFRKVINYWRKSLQFYRRVILRLDYQPLCGKGARGPPTRLLLMRIERRTRENSGNRAVGILKPDL